MSFIAKFADYKDPEIVKAQGVYPYFRPIQGGSGAHVVVNGKEKIMIGSNNYLGLANHPEVLEAAKQAVDKYGAGCTGSRFLNGNMDLHDQMEEELARFLKKRSSGRILDWILANLGTIPTITSRHSVIFSDRENHASITEGCNAALGKVIRYQHNNMQSLASLLEKNKDVEEKLIVSDGVFSMNGVIANLPELARLAKSYDAALYIDDAHALGVIGKNGRGTGEHHHLENSVDLVMGTFSKSLASIGGFVAGNKSMVSWVKHKARALIFSASIPPASVAVALKCLEIMQRHPELRTKLHHNTERARQGFKDLGFYVGEGEAAIVPVFMNGDRDFTRIRAGAFDKGLFSTPVLPPAVPQGTTLIRTSYMASHSDADIDRVLKVFAEVGEQFDVLGKTFEPARAVAG